MQRFRSSIGRLSAETEKQLDELVLSILNVLGQDGGRIVHGDFYPCLQYFKRVTQTLEKCNS